MLLPYLVYPFAIIMKLSLRLEKKSHPILHKLYFQIWTVFHEDCKKIHIYFLRMAMILNEYSLVVVIKILLPRAGKTG